MKKILIILALISITAFSIAQDKTGNIRNGANSLAWPFTFTAADSLAGKGGSFIPQGDSLVIAITNIQKYMQNQTVTTSLVAHSGTPSVVVTLRGRATSTDNWHPIGTAVTWETVANNPVTITATTPINYNYLKVSYVASGTTQCTQVTAFEVRTANAFDIPANSGTLTVSRSNAGTVTITTKDNSAHPTSTVYRAGSTGPVVFGSTDGTTAITSNGTVTLVGNLASTGTIDNVVTNSVAAGDKGLNEAITQVAGTALTGNLIGAGIVATNGTSAATGGVIYGIEAKARAADASNAGNTIGRLTGVYASVDAKNKTATTMRAFEASLDGGAGGTSTEAVAFEAFNNSSATQTASYAFSANGGTSGGHKAYTADLRLQNGETISNATDGSISVAGAINQAIAGGTVVVSAGLLGGAGTATSATQTLGSAGGKAFSYYLSSTSSTASHELTGYYLNMNYGATGGAGAAPSGDVIRGRAYLMGDASGTTALTGGAFSVELEASTASNTGLTAGMRGNLVLPDGVLTNAGTYYGTMAEVFLGGAATDTRAYTQIAPLGIVVSGTAATAAAQLSNMGAMSISVPANMVTSDATMVVTGATGAVAAGLKIYINGTAYWIMLATQDEP
jgi:hypothetical protein